MQQSNLSTNDASVLQALFDPEAVLASEIKIDTCKRDSYSAERVEIIVREEKDALRLINSAAPSRELLEETNIRLSKIITRNPLYAPAWNNRAQARRLLLDLQKAPDHLTEIGSIMEDLGQAITLATPSSPAEALSPMQAKVLASAHTHRGYLLWMASRSPMLDQWTQSIEILRGMDSSQLEEMASKDFFLGGRFGNSTAQQLAVKTNPYAKLCGNIVKEALQREITASAHVSV